MKRKIVDYLKVSNDLLDYIYKSNPDLKGERLLLFVDTVEVDNDDELRGAKLEGYIEVKCVPEVFKIREELVVNGISTDNLLVRFYVTPNTIYPVKMYNIDEIK